MNRAALLSLVACLGGAAVTPAQPRPDVSSPVVPAVTSVGSTGVPVEQPQAEDPKTNGAPQVEAPLNMGESAWPRPANPLEERLNLKPTIQLRGRIETEAVMAAQSAQSQTTIGDLQNGYGFRRVRLGAQGNIGDAASWVSEVELAGGSVRLRNVFIGLNALPGVRQIRIGHMREPYSLEGMTSSNFSRLWNAAR